jgi:hypothetical protein
MKKCFYPTAVLDAEWIIVKGNGHEVILITKLFCQKTIT